MAALHVSIIGFFAAEPPAHCWCLLH